MMIKNTFTRTNKKRTTLRQCIEQTEADIGLGGWCGSHHNTLTEGLNCISSRRII